MPRRKGKVVDKPTRAELRRRVVEAAGKQDAPLPANVAAMAERLTGRRKRVYSPSEQKAFLEFAEGVLAQGVDTRLAARLVGKKFPGCSEGYATKIVRRVREAWVEDAAETRPQNKAAAERRLMRDIYEASKDRKWSAVAQLEHLLSDIQGTREPMRVDVSVAVGGAVVEIIANMSGDDLERLAQEAAEAESLRRALPAHGVEVAEHDVGSTNGTGRKIDFTGS